ncbi:nephronectin isoform X4 [Delphinus delphis]|uniref:nephronectin isoform X4 n=1 Tax=Delphinus delphis TaxID=9728 RepID=UPI0028C4CC12|nr:nephronectin isoform X4 [Delphinus delphis]
MDFLLALVLGSSLYLQAAAEFDGRWPRQIVSSIGLCRYGGRIDCCWAWARRSWGQCQPVCQPQCKHGECIGPNKCKCHPGYAGKTCNQDLNECGLKPRPCKHRCMNTYGSYKCYCLNGYMLMPDGSCSNIDECSLGQYQCSTFARCYNVHGSYKCKCKDGYQGDGLNCVYIPKVMIEPSGPIHVPKENGTISRGDGGHSNWIPDVRSTRWPLKTPYVPAVITSRPTSEPTARPALKPAPQPAPPTELRTPPPAAAPGGPTTSLPSVAPVATVSPRRITVDNRIQTEPPKPRGDVFIPRQPSNDLFEIFEIERGVSADDEAKDDPGVLIHSCNFDHGLCGWIREKDSDLHWEPVRDPAGGQYLTVSAAKGPAGKAARLLLPLGHLLHSGDLCLSFRHKVTGLHSGTLQVFVRKHGAHGAALWGRNGGHSWRQTRITLRGADVKSVIFKGEKRRGHTGEIGLDDVSLKKGHCSEEREQLQN